MRNMEDRDTIFVLLLPGRKCDSSKAKEEQYDFHDPNPLLDFMKRKSINPVVNHRLANLIIEMVVACGVELAPVECGRVRHMNYFTTTFAYLYD